MVVTDRQTGGVWTDHYVNFPWMSHSVFQAAGMACGYICLFTLSMKKKRQHKCYLGFPRYVTQHQFLFSACKTTLIWAVQLPPLCTSESCKHRSLCTNAYATVKDMQTHTKIVYTWTWKDLLSCTGHGGKVGGRALGWLLFRASLQAARVCTCAWYWTREEARGLYKYLLLSHPSNCAVLLTFPSFLWWSAITTLPDHLYPR